MARNPNWTKDELILALDLYFRVNPVHTSENNPEIVDLSNLLNELPIHPRESLQEKFRNPSGIYMKMCNFLRFDPTYDGKGLEAGSRLDEVVWNEFSNDREKLNRIARLIRENYSSVPGRMNYQIDIEEDEEFEEGKLLTKVHKYRERNTKAVNRKKQLVLRSEGQLVCEICGFDFQKRYGDLGYGFAECHHTKPVSELEPGERTSLNELSIVCANCHRMIHKSRPMKTINEMRRIIHLDDKAN